VGNLDGDFDGSKVLVVGVEVGLEVGKDVVGLKLGSELGKPPTISMSVTDTVPAADCEGEGCALDVPGVVSDTKGDGCVLMPGPSVGVDEPEGFGEILGVLGNPDGDSIEPESSLVGTPDPESDPIPAEPPDTESVELPEATLVGTPVPVIVGAVDPESVPIAVGPLVTESEELTDAKLVIRFVATLVGDSVPDSIGSFISESSGA
jgi:hypothetical protein